MFYAVLVEVAACNLAGSVDGERVPVESATVYAQWHDPATALHWLDVAFKARSWELAEIGCDATFAPIRGTPEFKAIERQLGLPP